MSNKNSMTFQVFKDQYEPWAFKSILGCFITSNYNVIFRITSIGYLPLPFFAIPMLFTVVTSKRGRRTEDIGNDVASNV